jgi:transposase InsO family protein
VPKPPRGRDDEERLTADIIALARQYGRYGYRKVAALLRDAGWLINAKRVERIWRGLSDILCVGPVDHHAVTNRASNMMANCVFASDHSRGGIFQSAAT